MNLTDQEIQNFVGRIKLPHEKKTDYLRQIDTLKANVEGAIRGMDNAKVTRVLRTGSWKKGTALKPWGDSPLDVDLVFFVDVAEETKFDAEKLREEIIAVLRHAYPNKSRADFTEGKKTVGIVFKGTGLEMDIVPFVPDKGDTSYGRQPRKKLHSGEFRTSVDKQLAFIANVKQQWSSFTSVVRMIKWWRNRKELEFPSFAVELLFAHLFIERRIASDSGIEQSLIEFFEFVSANPNMRVGFSGAIGTLPGGSPIIADPTNNANNVLEKVDSAEWAEIIREAKCGFETVAYAQAVEGKTRTVELWREIFDTFTIEEA